MPGKLIDYGAPARVPVRTVTTAAQTAAAQRARSSQADVRGAVRRPSVAARQRTTVARGFAYRTRAVAGTNLRATGLPASTPIVHTAFGYTRGPGGGTPAGTIGALAPVPTRGGSSGVTTVGGASHGGYQAPVPSTAAPDNSALISALQGQMSGLTSQLGSLASGLSSEQTALQGLASSEQAGFASLSQALAGLGAAGSGSSGGGAPYQPAQTTATSSGPSSTTVLELAAAGAAVVLVLALARKGKKGRR